MSAWDDQHWNLAQAAGWVVYRDRRVVEELAEPSRHAFAAIAMYPSMHDYAKHGSVSDMRDALRDGRLTATGIRASAGGHRESIPKLEWLDLHLNPPRAVLRGQPGWTEPWTDIMAPSGDVKRLWRGELDVQGRTKYDGNKIRAIAARLRTNNPDMSENELNAEIEGEYESETGKRPARTTIQRHLKALSPPSPTIAPSPSPSRSPMRAA